MLFEVARRLLTVPAQISTGILHRFSMLRPGLMDKSLQVQPPVISVVPSRSKYTDWRMIREVKRRKVVKEYAKLRLQYNSIRYNDVLPKKLQEVASAEIHALPRASCHTYLHARCVLTSRARGRYKKFRMSRIIWRHLADYNQISGVERAMWG